MAAATLTEKGQIVIPAEIRVKYGLTPGTQVEFVDDGEGLRLVVRRRVPPSDPAQGYGMVKVASSGRPRHLSAFDAASVTGRRPRRRIP
jgi:antitoxin PrlF